MSLRVLVAPLDWGLGHTTRCIPVIQAFLQNGCTVYVACNADAKQLLIQEFSNLCFLPLAGYNIRYASSKRWFAFKILQQIPKIIFAVGREHLWLKKAVAEHKINLVISDNRYGLFHKRIPSIFITHQLCIQTPYRSLSSFIQKINYRFINRFTECWVPDYKEEINIAAALSHPHKLPAVPVTYLGPLSRFSKKETIDIKYKWLMVLSGPEPQRTALENQLVKLMPSMKGNLLLIRGLPAGASPLHVLKNCAVLNHLPTAEMQTAFAQSEYIISRSGYTTVMEIIAMQKKSILIPTPGQTEQEYLARHLMKQQWCFFCEQDDIDGCMLRAEDFNYQLPQLPVLFLQNIVSGTVKKYKPNF